METVPRDYRAGTCQLRHWGRRHRHGWIGRGLRGEAFMVIVPGVGAELPGDSPKLPPPPPPAPPLPEALLF